mmetsp:Transcript_7300/g.10607  ORF Transcript_7300/g.10607 Transcript_7300/m.10607 type:complete len:476 (-) Transcript_7300:757-2184(-)
MFNNFRKAATKEVYNDLTGHISSDAAVAIMFKVSYSTLLDAWSRSYEKEAPRRCEVILDALEELCMKRNSNVALNIAYYNITISAFARSEAKDAGSKAESILQRVEVLQASGYNIRPDLITFNSTLDAWAKSSEYEAASRAEALLLRMESLHEQNKLGFRPNHISYTTVINALAKSGGKDAAFKAEQLLLKMLQNYKQGNLDSKPNTVSFTSVIDAFAKCSSVDGPRKAEAILRLMERTYLEGNKDAEPNTVSYSAVVEAWARSKERDAHERAQKIVDEMITLERLGRSIRRNAVTYTSLINALARSKAPGKARKAQAILMEMDAMYRKGNIFLKPNMYVINGVLNACAFTLGPEVARKDATRILMNTLESMHQYGKPNQITYSIAFQAFSTLIKKHEEKAEVSAVVRTFFQQCCRDGLVDEAVFKKFRKAASKEVYHDLTGHIPSDADAIMFKDLPREWSFNVLHRAHHIKEKL